MQKLEIGAVVWHNQNIRGKENIIAILVNNYLAVCGVANGKCLL